MNTITVIGKLGKDPELRVLAQDKKVCKFSVCSNESKTESIWFNCESWGQTADFIEKWFHKGSDIFVSGRLKEIEYEGKKYINLVVEKVSFAGKSEQPQPTQSAAPQSQAQQVSQSQPVQTQQAQAQPDDLPF